MTIALFPGQGVQTPGMDGGLPESAPEVFATASTVLGVDVVELCRDGRCGPADLSSTRWAQPAVLACSAAAFEVLDRRGEPFVAAAGHSVGEYAALVAGGVLALTDALRLLVVRAEAMDEAAHRTPGGMAAVMRVDRETVEEICARTGVALAADNGPGQLVISGGHEELEAATNAVKDAGGVCRRLDIAGPFHSPAMAPAATALAEALDAVTFGAPRIDVWSSTTADKIGEPDEIRASLLDQLVSPVRWRETVVMLAARYGTGFADTGPGRVVGGLTRRLVEGAEVRYAADLLPAAAGGTS